MTRILAADDSASMRDMVRIALTGAGFEVTAAQDGRSALELARKTVYDLVLSDVNMPEMDGIELIRALRAEAAYRHTPILMLTTEGSADRKREGKELRLEQRRGSEQHSQAGSRAELRVAPDRAAEPGEHRRRKGDRHRPGAEQCADERPGRVEGAQPRHEDHETQHPSGTAARVQERQGRAGDNACRHADAQLRS